MHPFGRGFFPPMLWGRFNFAAFGLPLVWGIYHGVWPVFLGAIFADLIPALIMVFMPGLNLDMANVILSFLVLQLLISSIMRLWAGDRAYALLWKKEGKYMQRGKRPQPIADVLKRQQRLSYIALALFVTKAGLLAASYYEMFETNSLFSAYMAAGLVLAFNASALLAAYYMYSNPDTSLKNNREHLNLDKKSFYFIGPRFKVQDDLNIPALGLGTYKITNDDEVIRVVKAGLKAGYRHIDTASFYKNEAAIGRALRETKIPRNEIFLTSKIWNDEQGYTQTIAAAEKILSRLRTDYLDLLLVHWPIEAKMQDTWRALEHLRKIGKVKAIGVCNFERPHLEVLMAGAEIMPAVNQIELHPRFQRDALLSFCQKHDIVVEAWAPLMRGQVFELEELINIAKVHNKTAGQVALRWAYQRGCVVLPKSVHEDRIKENSQIFDFHLSDDEMQAISLLDQDLRIGPDPKTFSMNWPESRRQ